MCREGELGGMYSVAIVIGPYLVCFVMALKSVSISDVFFFGGIALGEERKSWSRLARQKGRVENEK